MKETIKNFTSKVNLETELKNVNRLEKSFNKKYLTEFVHEGKLYFAMLKDYFTKEYQEISITSIGIIIFTLFYILFPINLIPNFLPIVGILDDVFLLGLCLKVCKDDIERYTKWKISQCNI